MAERGYQLATSLSNELLTFFHDERRYDVVMMEGWNFDLNSFDSVAGHVSHLSVSTAGELRSSELESNDPFDLRFDSWVLWICRDIWNVQAAEREAAGLIACVNSLDFLESDIAARLLSLQRSIVAWTHLCMRIVSWISELIASTDGIKELDCLISTRRHYKLCLGHVANVHDRRIMCQDSFMARNVPRWSRLEKFDQISLEVPNQDLRLCSLLASRIVSCICIFITLLELVRCRDCGV